VPWRRSIAPAILLGLLVWLLVQQQRQAGRPGARVARPPLTLAPLDAVQLGVTTEPLARNWWRPWQPADLATVNSFERAAGKRASIVMWYADWGHSAPPTIAQLMAVQRRGSVAEITWEPWDASKPFFARQTRYALSDIVAGRFDGYIRAWAQDLAAWGRPVRLRFAQEMNGTWYPWSAETGGNRPEKFIAAWRHVHAIFAAARAANVRWVWSPFKGAPAADFPGVRYVDILGVTCLNGGTRIPPHTWDSFERLCGPSVRALHHLAPSLPIELSEVGSAASGGSKSAWISGLFAFLASHPVVRAFIWFDLRKGVDWRVDTTTADRLAFAAGVRSPRYG
jgi:hypothetical protein